MKKYERLLAILVVLHIVIPTLFAQQKQFKNEKRIYLWDVTLSMKGFGGKPNIYKPVVEALKKDINSIIDEQTEIVVLPFQMDILDQWSYSATKQGKQDIIGKIESYKNEKETNTNISIPFNKIMQNYIDPNRRNVLILMTDGEQNDPRHPMSELYDLIRKWCAFATKNDAYAFYVMLTSYAVKPELENVIDETCRISKVIADINSINLNFIELLPQATAKFNVKDDADKELLLKIECQKRVSIPAKVKIHAYCTTNDFVEIDNSTTIEEGAIGVKVKLKQSYDSLKKVLPQDYNEKITVSLKLEDGDENPLVQLIRESFELELVNKPEKTLKVYVKD